MGVRVVGFVVLNADWTVTGTVLDGSPGTYEDPPDPGEVEITAVHDDQGKLIPYEEWPLTPEDIEIIEQEMAEQPAEEYFDDRDETDDED